MVFLYDFVLTLWPRASIWLNFHLQEYSLPPQEVPVEKVAEEKPSSGTVTEVAPATNDETPPADETTAVEDKSETSEVQDVAEKSEAEETNPAAEETDETAEEEEAEEKPEIKVRCSKKLVVEYWFITTFCNVY